MNKTTQELIAKVYPPRHPEAKKYDFGLLLVVGGGEFYTGSPALAAMAAFRSGVDMVQVLAPKRAADVVAGFSPNLAAYPLSGLWLDEDDLGTLLAMTESAKAVAGAKTALVIGGGLGRSEATQKTFIDYLQEVSEIRAVIDADGIHAAAKNPQFVQHRNFIFTPHIFEFLTLTGRDIRQASIAEKAAAVQEAALSIGGVIILKGKTDIISNGHEVILNETGSPFMTVGGTGDTLAGICGAFLAQGVEPFLAAQAAAFINGKAGEVAAEKYGAGMTATDLVEAIPQVINAL